MFEFLTPVTAFSALILSFYNWTQSRRRTRRKLVDTIYYHTKYAIEAFQYQQKKNHLIQEKIKSNNSYTPYGAHSSADDLTYEHVIDVMEWLDEDGEKAVSSYFYTQMVLSALGQSFDKEFVRGWTPDRKLELWKVCEKYQEETLKYAKEAMKVLEAHRFLRRANRGKTNQSPGPE